MESVHDEGTHERAEGGPAPLEVAIIGAGSVGRSLGRGLAGAGHRVTYGVRRVDDPRHAELGSAGEGVAPVDAATAAAQVIVLAVPADAVGAAVESMSLRPGQVLIDATNAVRTPLPAGHDTLGGFVGAQLPHGVAYVKAFNTIGAEYLDGSRAGGRVGEGGAPFLPIAGDDAAVVVAERLATELGFAVVVLGDRTAVRLAEDHARLWIHLAFVCGWGRSFHFEAVRGG